MLHVFEGGGVGGGGIEKCYIQWVCVEFGKIWYSPETNHTGHPVPPPHHNHPSIVNDQSLTTWFQINILSNTGMNYSRYKLPSLCNPAHQLCRLIIPYCDKKRVCTLHFVSIIHNHYTTATRLTVIYPSLLDRTRRHILSTLKQNFSIATLKIPPYSPSLFYIRWAHTYIQKHSPKKLKGSLLYYKYNIQSCHNAYIENYMYNKCPLVQSYITVYFYQQLRSW